MRDFAKTHTSVSGIDDSDAVQASDDQKENYSSVINIVQRKKLSMVALCCEAAGVFVPLYAKLGALFEEPENHGKSVCPDC